MAVAALAVLVVLLVPARAGAQAATALDVAADQVSYDQTTQQIVAVGSVRLRYRGITLTADRVTVDLLPERLVASGQVVLIDAQGRELRGERLSYDFRAQLAEIVRTTFVIDRVTVSTARLQATPQRLLAEDATLTTCDPIRPAYRVTAAQIEVIPGERIVARNASLWLGAYRVLTLPVLVLSTRSPGALIAGLPRVGYNTADGLFVDYRLQGAEGRGPGFLYTKLGTRSFGVELGLTSPSPDPPPPGISALFTVGAGWFREAALATTRLRYEAVLRVAPLGLGPQTSWAGWASWSDAWYGTGDRQQILRAQAAVTHTIRPGTTLRLAYRRLEEFGASPFLFDTVPPLDQVHRVDLRFERVQSPRADLTATLGAGVFYDIRDRTPSVALDYVRRVRDRYHWGLGAQYNLTTQVLRLSTDSGLAVGRSSYVTVQAIYNTATGTFEDLDYILSATCDCIQIALKYRQVRRELWVEVGLAAP